MNTTTLHRRLAEADLYLQMLTHGAPAGALLDVRHRTGDEPLRRFFTGTRSRETARTLVRLSERADVYIGVVPRVRRSGTRRDVAPAALLWADLDTPAAVIALEEFEMPPALVLGSGRGAHAYWPLTQPLPARELESANHRLAHALMADARCADAARILRPAGTINHKYSPPRPVQITAQQNVRYRPEDLLERLPQPPTPVAVSTAHDRLAATGAHRDDPLQQIEPARYVQVLTGQRPGRDHKIRCPFHTDHTPSLHVYTRDRGWACFACTTTDGRPLGGDIYTLASLLWGIPDHGPDFPRLRDRLDDLFGVRREH